MRRWAYMLGALVAAVMALAFFIVCGVQEIQHGNPDTNTFQWAWILLLLSVHFETRADKEEGS